MDEYEKRSKIIQTEFRIPKEIIQKDFVYLCAIGDVEEMKKCEGVTLDEWSMGIVAAAARGHIEACRWIITHKPAVS